MEHHYGIQKNQKTEKQYILEEKTILATCSTRACNIRPAHVRDLRIENVY